jgi:cell wall assembly regulator SMI1
MPNRSAPAAAPRAIGDHASLLDSFRRLTTWMRANGAPLLAENLAPGAKPAQLVKLEHKLGFKVPPGLRALWLLHDGQRKPLNGFVGPLHLLPVAWVLNERAHTVALVKRLRAEKRSWSAAGVTPEEAQSEQWLPFAARDQASLLVQASTGRVFAGNFENDASEPPMHLVAPSVAKWLASYAQSVEDGQFELTPGLGEYHLAPREP